MKEVRGDYDSTFMDQVVTDSAMTDAQKKLNGAMKNVTAMLAKLHATAEDVEKSNLKEQVRTCFCFAFFFFFFWSFGFVFLFVFFFFFFFLASCFCFLSIFGNNFVFVFLFSCFFPMLFFQWFFSERF